MMEKNTTFYLQQSVKQLSIFIEHNFRAFLKKNISEDPVY